MRAAELLMGADLQPLSVWRLYAPTLLLNSISRVAQENEKGLLYQVDYCGVALLLLLCCWCYGSIITNQ